MARRILAWMLPLLVAGCGRGCGAARSTPAAPGGAPAATLSGDTTRAPAIPAPPPEAPPAVARGDAAQPHEPPGPPPSWRFDASDQQMQQLLQYALDTTGCRIDEPECPGLGEALRDGGDRLAAYLMDQYRRAGPNDPAAQALLDLVAATRSPAAIGYLEDELAHPERSGPDGARQAANALQYAPEVPTMSAVIRSWDRYPDDVALRMALVDAWERAALAMPERKKDGMQGLRLLQTDPSVTPELRGHIAAAQVCLELGRGCPTP